MKTEQQLAMQRAILVWLAHEASTGSSAALERLLTRLQQPILTFAARKTRCVDAAADIWQETAMAVSAGILRLKDTTNVRAWVYRIAYNKCMDHFRANRATAPLEQAPEAGDTGDLDSSLDLRRLIARLDPSDQDLIYLFYHQGLSLNEIAAALELSPGAARVRLCRARATLRSMTSGDSP